MNELKKQIGAVVALLEKYNLQGKNLFSINIGVESQQLNGAELLTCNIYVTGKKSFHVSRDNFKTALQHLEIKIVKDLMSEETTESEFEDTLG